ncbi:transcriptional regulator [Actinomadura decatromicini]|uniref:Transcriptional regulator n=1 Tax=Actinomadura decatromicini TaxID=2604572 RepID=A0A5D3FQR8_9ACTN|nr:transcriptional regulator [Actinomadura decatromicini]TYK50569.1 transcriptional regulator [Actinomadura decatromicini]
MSADRKKIVGARLREARESDPYWSRGDLARLFRAKATPEELPDVAHVESLTDQIKQWECGKHVPKRGGIYRTLYVRVTGRSEDELFGDPDERLPSLWRPQGLNGEFSPDDEERLVQAIEQPRRVDLVVVRSLAAILAMQRRLDDTVGPAAILPATLAQTKITTDLLREARGSVRASLAPVAAEYVQFAGWLHAELRHDRDAVHWLTDAEELADVAGSGELAAQAANFKGYLARQQGNPRGVVRHFLTAYHAPGAAPAQRLGDAVQAAQGLAQLGEDGAARRLLSEAEGLEEDAARSLPPDTAYWLTGDFQHINIGLALAAMGEHAAAAEHLAHGLNSLPPDQRDAQWTHEYREALDRARELSS